MDVDGGRCLAVPDQPITIEFALDGAAAVDGDLTEERMPEPVDDAALRLRLDARLIDDDAAVQGAGDAMDGHATARADRLARDGSTDSSTTWAQYEPNVKWAASPRA